MTSPDATTRVAILIVTKERPRMLGELLASIAALRVEAGVRIEVVVVDNDPAASARDVVERFRAASAQPTRYEVEPRAGIPFARNRAVACAHADCDFVVFVDDDERVTSGWLAELLRVQREHDADVVTGPVRSVLPESAPAWATRGEIFAHPRHRTGERVTTSATNNVLVRTRVFRELSPWFDERLALSGGSDRHFFLRVHDAGFKIVWADAAEVEEEIPESRVDLGWVLKRMYRQGACNAFCEVDLQRVPFARAQMAARGVGFVALGLGLLPVGLVTGSHRLVHYARYVSYGAGLFQGARGRFHQEYARIHGS